MSQITEKLAGSKQPLVPERLIILGGGSDNGANGNNGQGGLFQAIMQVLTTWQVMQEEPKAIDKKAD